MLLICGDAQMTSIAVQATMETDAVCEKFLVNRADKLVCLDIQAEEADCWRFGRRNGIDLEWMLQKHPTSEDFVNLSGKRGQTDRC